MDLTAPFKFTNLFVAAVSVIGGATQLLSGVQEFFLGLYLIALGAGIGTLEFSSPPAAHTYASFAFSFLGRGVVYFLIGVLIAHGNALRIILGLLVSLVGLAYGVLEFVESIEAPENMKVDGHHELDEDDVI